MTASIGAAELTSGTAASSPSVGAALLHTDPSGIGTDAGALAKDGQGIRDLHALSHSSDHLAAHASDAAHSGAGRPGGGATLAVAAAVVFATLVVEQTVTVLLAFVLTAPSAHRSRRWQRAGSRLPLEAWK